MCGVLMRLGNPLPSPSSRDACSYEEARAWRWHCLSRVGDSPPATDVRLECEPDKRSSGRKRLRDSSGSGVSCSPESASSSTHSATCTALLVGSNDGFSALPTSTGAQAFIDGSSQTLLYEDFRPANILVTRELAFAKDSAERLRASLSDASSQLEAALTLVAGIPPLVARCAELEALVDELQLISHLQGNDHLDEAAATSIVHALPPPSSPTSANLLRAQLAASEREVVHKAQLCAELQMQVWWFRVVFTALRLPTPECSGTADEDCAWPTHGRNFCHGVEAANRTGRR